VSGVSAASGRRGDQFDRKRNFSFMESHPRIKKRISNVEGRNSIEFYGFKRQSVAIPPFNILRLDILLFCGSLFGHAEFHTRFQGWMFDVQSSINNHKSTCGVSYKEEAIARHQLFFPEL
jgi:hypothetical protein